jgi:Nif-specific regulatory protein
MTSFSDHARLRLDSLIEINQLLLSSIEPDELIRIILNSAIRLFTSEACSIAVLDEDSRQLVIDFSAGDTLVQGVRIDVGQGIAGWVARTGEGVLCNDVSADPRFWSGIDQKTGFETRTILCTPLKQQGRIIGVIEVLNTLNPAGFEQDDLKLLNVFGGLAATAISRARAVSTIHNANIAFQEVLQERYRFVVGKSPAMQSALRLARTVAPAATTVLLLGESGTGKEVMARFIHQVSPRSAHPFVAVNCVALTQELMESELFGHEKGAFTGAITQKKGSLSWRMEGQSFWMRLVRSHPGFRPNCFASCRKRNFSG